MFTLDIHKTKYYFHTNVSIVDGHKHGGKDWILRDHLNTRVTMVLCKHIQYLTDIIGQYHQ